MGAVIASVIALAFAVAVFRSFYYYVRIGLLAPGSRAVLRKIKEGGVQTETQLRSGLQLGLPDFHNALDELNREGYIEVAGAHDDELIWAIRR